MGLVNDFAFEVDYGLSRLQLFQKITHNYPAQFAEDLAEVLWITLEVFSEIDLTLNVQSSLTIPVRVQECGSCNSTRWKANIESTSETDSAIEFVFERCN